MTPKHASSPNALPPARTAPCTRVTRCPGSRRSSPRSPEAPPRTSTAATAPAGQSTAVHPVRPTRSAAWPTRRPATSVSPPTLPLADLPQRRARRATRDTRGQPTGRDLAGDLEASLDQRPEKGNPPDGLRAGGITEGARDRHRCRRLGCPTEGQEDIRLVLQTPGPATPGLVVEVRLDHAVDDGREALGLDLVAQHET